MGRTLNKLSRKQMNEQPTALYSVFHNPSKLPMEPKDIRLYMTLEKRSFVYRAYACAHFSVIIGLIYYRLMYIPGDNYCPWILIFFAELGFAYSWILEQAFKWWPVERKVFTKRLSQRFESDLPPVDIFICTADPIKEPPLTVVNTLLFSLALDYTVGKLSCYVSDDGGSSIIFYDLSSIFNCPQAPTKTRPRDMGHEKSRKRLELIFSKVDSRKCVT